MSKNHRVKGRLIRLVLINFYIGWILQPLDLFGRKLSFFHGRKDFFQAGKLIRSENWIRRASACTNFLVELHLKLIKKSFFGYASCVGYHFRKFAYILGLSTNRFSACKASIIQRNPFYRSFF